MWKGDMYFVCGYDMVDLEHLLLHYRGYSEVMERRPALIHPYPEI